MTNGERIVTALEPFGLPIFQNEIPEDKLDDMNFFYYRPVRLERNGTAHLLQVLEVAYVSEYQEDLQEEEIIDALESKGLKFRIADYDRVQMVKTSAFVDIVTFTVVRPLKRRVCVDGYQS